MEGEDLHADIAALHRECQQHIAKIERLRAALKPFANCIDDHTVYQGDPNAEEVEVGNWAQLRYNDFVRAREAFRDLPDR